MLKMTDRFALCAAAAMVVLWAVVPTFADATRILFPSEPEVTVTILEPVSRGIETQQQD